MTFIYCDYKGKGGQRVAEDVCRHNLETGRCKKTLKGCQPKKEVHISDEERKRRADAIREIARQARLKREQEGGGSHDEPISL